MSHHSIFSDPVQLVHDGLAVWEWEEVEASSPEVESKLVLRFMKDAMRLPAPDGRLVRFCVNAKQQQEIADLVGGVFHTSKTADLRHEAATLVIEPITRIDGNIAALSTDRRHSELVDAAIVREFEELSFQDRDFDGIVSSVGKPWSVTNQMDGARYGDHTAFNYGWHSKSGASRSPGGLRIWQPIVDGWAALVHNDDHSDPSQVCEFPSDDALLVHPGGHREAISLASVYQHPIYSKIVSYEGPLFQTRQKSVPRRTGTFVLPPFNVSGKP